jgi:hypothetical protein
MVAVAAGIETGGKTVFGVDLHETRVASVHRAGNAGVVCECRAESR